MKAAVMIKFGYVMLAFYMLIALAFWIAEHSTTNVELQEDHHVHTLMFMTGSCFWIIMLLVWYKVLGQQQENQ